jgi:hypothetical protein
MLAGARLKSNGAEWGCRQQLQTLDAAVHARLAAARQAGERQEDEKATQHRSPSGTWPFLGKRGQQLSCRLPACLPHRQAEERTRSAWAAPLTAAVAGPCC